MKKEMNFIKATQIYNTFENNVCQYYFRRAFKCENSTEAELTIAASGFYKLYFNGKDITKGFLSPYISYANDNIYYDKYILTLDKGENVIAVIQGNGFINNPGGYIWDFDKSDVRSAPYFAIDLYDTLSKKLILKSDTDFKIAQSPIRSDDYRFGEHYDANYEIDGWNSKGFDDSTWENAIAATPARGQLCLSDVPPIVKECEIAPVSITRSGDGFIYDFGISNAGVCRLKIQGEKGQKITLRHADMLSDGDIFLNNVWFLRDSWERDKNIVHCDSYVCSGKGTEVYQPSFTYHGFRYVRIDGITESQATKDLLTFLVYHTDLKTRGDFNCSDSIANTLQLITRRSITSNFHHFPTDCPQREKNGWTADAALSCEAAMINFDPERNYRQWLNNICKAQNDVGALPGIVPTTGWGFHWGNGPAWDCVLAYLPYFTYIYRGQTEMITDAKDAFIKYLKYLRTRADEKGLMHIGLGDWCHVEGRSQMAPLKLTDTVMSMDIASKIAIMLNAVNMPNEAMFAESEAQKYRQAIRNELIDHSTMTVCGSCQASQAMALFYGVFEDSEKEAAFAQLLRFIKENDDHINLGVLGGRVIFHVLSQFGYSDLAYKMITREDYPSYGNWLKRGATTLWENFHPTSVSSMNHHFWGDISAWFIKTVAGIKLNPTTNNVNSVEISPDFISSLDRARAYHIAPLGKISVEWERTEDCIVLELTVPSGMEATAVLNKNYTFTDGQSSKKVHSGLYRVIAVNA